MYLVYIIDQIHHLFNEPKIFIFAYNNDQRKYLLNPRRMTWNSLPLIYLGYNIG